MDMFADHPADKIFQLEARPRGRSPGCLQSGLDHTPGKGLCQPPIEPSGESAEQSTPAEGHTGPDSPCMENQPWYPALLEMMIDFPVLLLQRRDMCHLTHPVCVPHLIPQLAAWHISGNATRIKRFQKRAQRCSLPRGGRSRHGPTTHSSGSGYAGIRDGVLVPFQDL